MKGIRVTELFATIKVNIVAFFSISMFVCLGVALFLGIQWGSQALGKATNEIARQGNLHDIEVSFPYGITDDDISAIKKVDGVDEVETGYTAFATMVSGNTSYVLKFQSMTENIDMPTYVDGRLPEKNNEVALLKFWAEKNGVKLGDTINLKHDAAQGDGMQYLQGDSFVVTAFVDNPAYLFKQSTMLGISNLGSGSIDCVAFVKKDAFKLDSFNGNVPNVYVRCHSLDGFDMFSKEYKDKCKAIADAISEIGEKRAGAQYHKVYDEAKGKVDDAERVIQDGERQLADGRRAIEEGTAAIESGEAQRMLDEAYQTLANGQAKYEAGLETYNTAVSLYNQVQAKFAAVAGTYDILVALYGAIPGYVDRVQDDLNEVRHALDAYNASPDYPSGERWMGVDAAYRKLISDYTGLSTNYNSLGDALSVIGTALGIPAASDTISVPTSLTTPDEIGATLNDIQNSTNTSNGLLSRIASSSITIGDTTISLLDIPGGMNSVNDTLASTKQTLDSSKVQLDAGWAEYYANKELFEQKKRELAEGKKTIDDKTRELEEGKSKLEEGKDLLNMLVEYEWVVIERQDNGGIQCAARVMTMTNNVRWAMASLFILVGLFVCYSAMSRLIHEAIVQIGTKKAMGFRNGETAFLYLMFAAIAVVVGVVISIALSIFLVQGITNPKAARQFAMPQYGPYFNVFDLVLLGAIELALILASTWLAIRNMLKRNAVDLLRGETKASAKEHFYERWAIWKKMSLFSQTVVNNCVNDKRRVFATLIGVVGCTALIVVAVTLSSNVSNSLTKHYKEVHLFDSVAYLTEGSQTAAERVAMKLYDRGVSSSPAFIRQLQVRREDGPKSLVKLVVPTNEETFEKMYHMFTAGGEPVNRDVGGIWISAAYAEHFGAKAGDTLTLTENTGKTHDFKIAGVFEYYLMNQEFVLSKGEYRAAFGEDVEPNVVLARSDGKDIGSLRDTLKDVEGYSNLADDKEMQTYLFNELTGTLDTVVLIYLALSALMAVMVLLNLNVMFVNEKKRELIVLMICGFSTRAAKAYIYRDSIVLTVIGIILGIVVGAIMGSVTIFALEPDTAYWLKGFSPIAAAVGAVGAGVFAAAVLIWALRQIDKFDLTDINRF